MAHSEYKAAHQPDRRKLRIEIVVLFVVLLCLAAGALFLLTDISRNKTVVDNSKNSAVLGRVENPEAEKKKFVEPDYEFETPEGWQKVASPQILINGYRYYPNRYQGVVEKQIGRRIDVYQDDWPADIPINKVVDITVDGGKIIPNSISSQCYQFTDIPEGKLGQHLPSTWKDHNFTCRTSTISNDVIALNKDATDGIALSADGKTINIFIVYRDHGSYEDNSIFLDILESFSIR